MGDICYGCIGVVAGGSVHAGGESLSRAFRNHARARLSSRDTCICETPNWVAICDWVRLP